MEPANGCRICIESLPGECQDSLVWSRGGPGDSLQNLAGPSTARHPTSNSTNHRRRDTGNRNVSRRDPLRGSRCNPVRSRDHLPTSRIQAGEYCLLRRKKTRLVTPRSRRALAGNARCSALSSWRQTTSGCALASHAVRLCRRLLMLLMLKVAIFNGPTSCEKTILASEACHTASTSLGRRVLRTKEASPFAVVTL